MSAGPHSLGKGSRLESIHVFYLPSLVTSNIWHFLACSYIMPIFASILTWHSVCVCVSSYHFIRTLGIFDKRLTVPQHDLILWLPRWCSGKESTCQCRKCKRHSFDPWVGKIPWRRKWQPTLAFLPRKYHGQRSLESTVHGVERSQTQLSHWAGTHDLIIANYICKDSSSKEGHILRYWGSQHQHIFGGHNSAHNTEYWRYKERNWHIGL